MRVLLAPDCFTGTLSAPEAAEALARGWASVAPRDDLDLCPLSDGGPGLLEVLRHALPGCTDLPVVVEDPLARPVPASVLLHRSPDGTDTAYVESALACGLHLLAPDERDPARTTTYGVGQLVAAALDAGARRVVVGLGGSGTHDGGAGALAALGMARYGRHGRLGWGGAPLVDVVRLEGRPRTGAELVAATDVDVPLGGAALFLPQKGPADVDLLTRALTRWADVVEAHLGVAVRDLPGSGAAGGLGFGLLAAGGRRESGLGVVAEAVRLRERVERADLVVTGEGSFDATSLLGKVTGSVAALAQEAGVPCLVLAGQVGVGRREAAARGVDEALSLTDLVGLDEALAAAGPALQQLAARAAGSWSRG